MEVKWRIEVKHKNGWKRYTELMTDAQLEKFQEDTKKCTEGFLQLGSQFVPREVIADIKIKSLDEYREYMRAMCNERISRCTEE